MTTSEKVAYLKGLAEGFGLDPNKKEGKLLSTLLDILEDLAFDQGELSDTLEELEEGLDAVSDDLADVEEILFGDGPYENVGEDDDEDWNWDASEAEESGEAEAWDGETAFYEAQCPACGETVTFDEGVLSQGSIQCPSCGEKLEFDLDFTPDLDIDTAEG